MKLETKGAGEDPVPKNETQNTDTQVNTSTTRSNHFHYLCILTIDQLNNVYEGEKPQLLYFQVILGIKAKVDHRNWWFAVDHNFNG